jgi:glycosyltransferase involved in cell wall biosynthesis
MVSILIGTYNNLPFFKLALESVLNQSYLEYEIIISDDSTNNDIYDFMQTVVQKQIRYYKNAYSLGISQNMLKLINYSKGEYFTFLNHDDIWSEVFLEKIMFKMLKYDVEICFSDHWLIDQHNLVLTEKTNLNTSLYKRDKLINNLYCYPFTKEFYINYTVPVAMASVFKKSLIYKFNFPSIVGPAYDKWILLNYILLKSKIFYIPERLTYYRIHSSSSTVLDNKNVLKSVIYVLSISVIKNNFTFKEKRILIRQLISYTISYINPF